MYRVATILWLSLIAVASQPVQVPGQSWPTPPASLGQAPSDPRAALHDLLQQARLSEALPVAVDAATTAHSPLDRAALWTVVGTLHRYAGHLNRASEAFTKVRQSDTVLSPLGAYYEAEQDYLRGRPGPSLHECDAVIARWPETAVAERCAQLRPFAAAKLGLAKRAMTEAKAWDESHPEEPITEAVQLTLALADIPPSDAISYLRDLTIHFAAPLTERIAQNRLKAFFDQGHAHATMPTDLASRKARAESLRHSGRRAEAWQAFLALHKDAVDAPQLTEWIRERGPSFAASTRHYQALADIRRQEIARADANDLPALQYRLYRALDRAGQHNEALDLALAGLKSFGEHREWRRKYEVVARTAMLAKRYTDAVGLFETAVTRQGGDALRPAYYAAFCAQMAGDFARALTGYADLIDPNTVLETEARYWRAKIYDNQDPGAAKADRDWILTHDPYSWYALMLQADPQGRDGRWPGPVWEVHSTQPVDLQNFHINTASALVFTPTLSTATAPHPLQSAQAQQDLQQYFASEAQVPPDLRAAATLANVGLHSLSGPLMHAALDALDARADQDDPAAIAVEDWLGDHPEAYQALIYGAGDNYHIVRSLQGDVARAPRNLALLRATHPLAQRAAVWKAGLNHHMDPLLILSIMRVESLYNDNAVSYAGARGPMQIMPRTGHLLADRLKNAAFTVTELHEPATAIDLGSTYLSLLLERFDGVFPLAVASYNGGPHNVSAWLDALGHDMPLDLFVEHIPFGQTRRYVRKVTEVYGTYAALYASQHHLAIPHTPRGDDASIVDF